jgi:putative ABC transport system ATP-binding protein
MNGPNPAPARGSSRPLVRVDDVSKSYLDGPAEIRVLEGVNLEVARGETISLTGASGSGKSTLVSLLAGMLLPGSGRVFFEDDDLTTLDDVERARLRAARIGIVLQSGNLIPFLTASENVELAMDLADAGRSGSRARRLLSALGLADRLDHLPRRMSGGEAQRVAVAVALANEPDLLLADEVTGELDSSNAEQVMQLIFDAQRERGLAVVYVTHSEELAARARRRLHVRNGELRSA